jgi:NAD(P)-dependent dehydrogenase (short-subunit alcohol dehydrogenase family)
MARKNCKMYIPLCLLNDIYCKNRKGKWLHNLIFFFFNYSFIFFNSVFACRNREKTESVINDIKKETKNENLEFLEIDMTSLSSVKRFVSEFFTRYDKVDILLNNAGVMTAPTPYSKDGIDYQLAVNHVAHHYLTISLLPLLQKQASSRVVNVASEMHRYTSKLGLDKINTDEHAGKFESYGISKVANILFTRELARRLKEQGIEVKYNIEMYIKKRNETI